MDIIRFIEDPGLLNDQSLSPAQKMALKASYGLPLDDEELELFKLTTGLSEYPHREWLEITFLLGRKSGKSNQITSNMAIYEALQPHPSLSRGETGICMIVASEQERQSKIIFRYILAKLEGSRILRNLIRKQTGSMIELTNGVLIQIFPAHLARVRGAAIIFFAGDEVAYWKHEGVSIDREVFDAVRPGMVEGSKIVKISSPYWMKGECWFDYKNFFGKPNDHVLVFQGKTALFNPSYSLKQLDQARRRDPLAFRNEYEAQFRADLSAMYDPAMIESSINYDRPMELEPREGIKYFSFVDCAGGGGRDSYALAIGHRSEGKIIIDVVRSRAPKFNPEEVTRQYSDLLRGYRIASVVGDKFSGDFSLHAFGSCGIGYIRSEKSKSMLYLEAEGIFNSGQIEIPDRKILLTQLRSLVRKVRSGGADSVDSDSGQPEDESNVVAGLASMLGQWMPLRKGSVSFSGRPGTEKPVPPPTPGRRLGRVQISTGGEANPRQRVKDLLIGMSQEELHARRMAQLQQDDDEDSDKEKTK
jgi:hypothetical protein